MNPIETEITHDFPPFFRVYKNGRVEKLNGAPIVPPSTDPKTSIVSKDVIISQNVSARLYLPTTTTSTKLPLLIYIHGGAFSIESAFSTLYHTHLNTLTAAAGIVGVSVEYRLAPEHPIPACYEDAWETLKWVQQMLDPWIKNHADLYKIFIAGDSAGANIAHNLVVRAGVESLHQPGLGLKIMGMVLVHPYFEFGSPGKLWMHICPGSAGVNDPRINPSAEPGLLEKIGCKKVLVCVAGKDGLKGRGLSYYETLKKSSWLGDVDIMETPNEDHVFHLFKPDCEEAHKLVDFLASYFQQVLR